MLCAKAVLDRFDELDISYELYPHAPIETYEQRLALNLDLDGAVICKNLFLTTRNESVFLLYMLQVAAQADLRALARRLGTSRLCFGSDERLECLLGLRRGCVGISGLLYDNAHAVSLVLDSTLKRTPRVAMHPGDNAMTAILPFDDILRYIQSCGTDVTYF